MRKFLSFWKDILTFNIGPEEDLKGFTAVAFWVVFSFWTMSAIFSAGADTRVAPYRCVVTRPLQLFPTYLVACTLFGEKPPTFKIDWRD